MAKVTADKLGKFRPQTRNANRHTQRGMGQLEASMRKYGYVTPMTAAADGEIIDGSARAETGATVFGDDVLVVHHDGTKPVIMVRDDIHSADTPEAREISIAANRIAQVNLDFDPEVLLGDLQAGVDLTQFWRQDELDELLADLTPKVTGDTEPQTDRAEELREKWGVQPGQLWQLGEHRLICGDCTDAATVARVMGGEKAAFCVTSPPYPSAEMWETDAPELIRIGNDCLRSLRGVLVEGAALAWNTSDVPTGKGGVACNPARDTMTALELGYTKRAEIIWEKGLSYLPMPWNTRRPTVPNSTHESILVFFNGERKARENEGNLDTDALGWNRESVWKMGTAKAAQTNHKAAFPLDLASRCITLFSFPDDVVYEPFSGSGTTIIACENLGRRCRACEISAAYTAVALQRYADHTQRTPVLLEA